MFAACRSAFWRQACEQLGLMVNSPEQEYGKTAGFHPGKCPSQITSFGQPGKHASDEDESLSLCVGKGEAALPRLGILNFSFPPCT